MNEEKEISTIEAVLQGTKHISVVGYSGSSFRAGRYVPDYLADQGYAISAVNPNLPPNPGGVPQFDSLEAVDRSLDLVLIFRRQIHLAGIVDDVLKIGANAIWMQLELRNEQAAARARSAGTMAVMDAFMMVEHRHWEGADDTV